MFDYFFVPVSLRALPDLQLNYQVTTQEVRKLQLNKSRARKLKEPNYTDVTMNLDDTSTPLMP